MNFRQLMSVLAARKWYALTVFILVVATTATVSALMPRKYTATAEVVIDMKADPIAGLLMPAMAATGYMATQVDIFRSDRVARRVVANLKLAENPEVRNQWMEATLGRGSIEAWLAGSLQENLEVKPSRESTVIAVSYKARDPRFAAALANAFVQAYLDTTLELRVDPARQYTSFFDTRAKDLRSALEDAQTKLSNFQREKGIFASDERLDIETSRLNELSTQLTALQAISAESSSRQALAQGASADRLPEVLNNQLVSTLKGELSRSEVRLQELTARLGDAHPQVIETRANIAELRSKLGAETRRVSGGATVANTINRQREAEVKASLDAQRAKVLKMKAQRDDGSVLVKDVENAQRAYDQVLARRNQTTLESQTTQTNILPLTQASMPSEPSSPKVVLNTILSVVIGLMLAVGTVLALELLDRRVRVAGDLVEGLGLPVLGIVPGPARRRRLFNRTRAPLLPQRVLGQLPNPTGRA